MTRIRRYSKNPFAFFFYTDDCVVVVDDVGMLNARSIGIGCGWALLKLSLFTANLKRPEPRSMDHVLSF